MQILLPWKNPDFHNTSYAIKDHPKVRSNLMTSLQNSILKIRTSAYKTGYTKWPDTALTWTGGGDSHITARFSCGPEHEVVARSEVSFA